MKVKKTFVSRLALLLLAVCMIAVLASCEQLFGNPTDTTEATTPDAGTTSPDTETTAPDTETTAPDTETTAPDTETTDPDTGDNTGDRVDTSDLYYFSFAESFFTTEGIALKIKDFVIDVETDDSTPNGLQKINSLEVAELEISLNNGELYGAAHGKAYITFFDTIDGTVEFSAIISDGYLYLALSGNANNMDEQMYQKYSLENLFGDMMGADSEVLAFVENTLLPTVESLINTNAVSIDTVLGNVLNIFFTFEKQEDNTVLVTLSKDKVLALNEALATKPIAEVIDVYFGEGAYDSIIDCVFEILDLKISEIPAYLKSKGIDYDDLIEKINALLALTGAPEDIDIDVILTSSDYANLIIGEVLMAGIAGGEGDEGEAMPAEAPLDYKTFIEENILVMLEEATLYDLMGAPAADAKAMIDDVIAQVFDFVSLSFVTEEKGAFKTVQVTLNKIPVGGSSMGTNDSPSGEMNDKGDSSMGSLNGTLVSREGSFTIITYTYYLSASIEVVANGTVEVTWGDIIEKINASLAPVPEEFKDEYGFQADDNGGVEEDARITFQGQEYICQSRSIWVSEVDFDTVLSTEIYSDCAGWFNYMMDLRTKEYKYQTYFAGTDDAPILFLVNPDTDEIVKIEPVSGGFNVTDEEGNTKHIIMAIGEEDSMMTITAKLFPMAFENVEYIYSSTSVYFYYNPTTKEYAYEEQHEWEYSYKMLGNTCEDGYEYTETCTKCGNTSMGTENGHRYEDTYINLSELGMCDAWVYGNVCTVCKQNQLHVVEQGCVWNEEDAIDGYRINKCENCKTIMKYLLEETEKDSNCKRTRIEILIYVLDGKEIFKMENVDTYASHDFKCSYQMYGKTCDDGYKATEICSDCGAKNVWEGIIHSYNEREVDLGEFGLCGGWAHEEYCNICNTVISASAYDDCWWEFVENVDGYDIYECQSCGATKKHQITTTQNGCKTETTETTVYIMGDKEIFNITDRYTFDSHDWERSFEMFGKTCEDGWRVTEHCIKCGQKDSWEKGGHYTELNKVNLSDLGLCSDILTEEYCLICGKVMWIEFDAYNCNWETVEETDTTWTQKCSICNAILTEIYTDEGYTYIITVDGQEVYNKTVSYK